MLSILSIKFEFVFYASFRIDVCVTVTTVTYDYGSENSWSLGTCDSEQTYSTDATYTQVCCLDYGVHTLTCMDSYGDGWYWSTFNGYVEIDGVRYCEDFNSGSSQSHDITYSGKILVNNHCYLAHIRGVEMISGLTLNPTII